ncbi:glycosyltransferase family 4 protein [Peribacillus asahii]|uniref:glycosyltransferase family 4 protein n=1 Tax=Peribacillus asahii TaxID=228899 RepID=UPI0038276C8E
MKILFITNLYPYDIDFEQDKNTKALYNITKLWDEDLEVIRPLFLPTEFKDLIEKKVYKKNKVLINNVKVHVLPICKIPGKNIYFYKSLIRYVKRNQISPDVIITHRLHSAIGASKLARIYNKPLILGLHNADILYLRNSKMKNYYLDLFEQAVFVACRSQSILNEITKIYPQYTHKYFIAFSGIEKSIINPIEKTLTKVQEWKGKERPIRFITAATLKKLKNIDINLRALSMLNKTIKWEYYIIGDGNEMVYLKNLSQELGISNRVFFLGKKSRAEVLTYMEKSDIFIMVSEPETFGLSYIEAMAKGCIVIGALNNGIDGVVQDGFNGFLCTPRSVEELTDKIGMISSMDISELSDIILQTNQTIIEYTEENAARTYIEKVRTCI